jgi:hypothetical protein
MTVLASVEVCKKELAETFFRVEAHFNINYGWIHLLRKLHGTV